MIAHYVSHSVCGITLLQQKLRHACPMLNSVVNKRGKSPSLWLLACALEGKIIIHKEKNKVNSDREINT